MIVQHLFKRVSIRGWGELIRDDHRLLRKEGFTE